MHEGVKKQDVAVRVMDSKEANTILAENHYLHRKRVGRLLAYEVLHLGRRLGIVLYARAPVSGPMFGYTPTEIVELARFWLSENLHNLGSCAIRKTFREITKDWPGTRAIISWCDRTRFDGALYKAVGFEFMGESRVRSAEPSGKVFGGGRAGREVQADRLNQKDRYLYKLTGPASAAAWVSVKSQTREMRERI